MNMMLAVRIDFLKVKRFLIRDPDAEFFKRFLHPVNIHFFHGHLPCHRLRIHRVAVFSRDRVDHFRGHLGFLSEIFCIRLHERNRLII